MTSLASWIYHWQTLLTGLLAIAAAFVGGYFVNKQIVDARRLEADRIARRFSAMRSVLPLTLSYLSAYARDNAEALKDIYSRKENNEIPNTINLPKLPELPLDVVPQLRDMIETSDKNVAKVIAELLAKIQVQSSRIGSLKRWRSSPQREMVTSLNIEGYILDTAEIYARAAALFDFARRKSDTVRYLVTSSELKSALDQLGFWREDFVSLHEQTDRRARYIAKEAS